MKFRKQLTINIGNYESLRVGVEDAPSYEACDAVIISELRRIDIAVSKKIRQCLQCRNQNADVE